MQKRIRILSDDEVKKVFGGSDNNEEIVVYCRKCGKTLKYKESEFNVYREMDNCCRECFPDEARRKRDMFGFHIW